MFPLVRNQVEYSETDIGAILHHFILPPFQRAERELHVQELYHQMKAYYNVHHDIMFTGSISLAKYPDGSDKKNELCLLDGQHRVRALQLLAKEMPDILSIPIRTDIYTITSEEQKLLLYEIINKTKKVDLFSTTTEYETWPQVEKWFKEKFLSYWKESNNPVLLNINREQVRTRMESLGILKKKHTEVLHELEKMLAYFKAQDMEAWIRWGFTLDTPDRKRIDPTKAQFLEQENQYLIRYKSLVEKLLGIKANGLRGEYPTQDDYIAATKDEIYDNSARIRSLYKKIDTPKTVSPQNIEKWLVIKLYDNMIQIPKEYNRNDPDNFYYKQECAMGLALLLSYPLYPITFERLHLWRFKTPIFITL